MPKYTQTPTQQKHITFDSSEQSRLRRERDEVLRNLLSFTPQERSILFENYQKSCEDEIYHHITQLMLWVATTEHTQDIPLTSADFERKIREEREKLKALDSTLPVDKYFLLGSDDTAKCGHLLIIKHWEWNETQQKNVTILLSGIQWLTRMKEALEAATDVQKPKEKAPVASPQKEEPTVYEALRTLFINCLHLKEENTNTTIGEKSWNKMRLIVATMHVLADRKTLPTSDEKAFASLVAPIIGKDPENLRKNINKHQLTIKPYGCNLKELSESYIKKHPSDDDKAMSGLDFRKYWNGMFELIDGFINTVDELKPLRAKSA